jgi:hypothetical protein
VSVSGDDRVVMVVPLGLIDDRATCIKPSRCGAKQLRHTFRRSLRQPHEHIRVVIAERPRERGPEGIVFGCSRAKCGHRSGLCSASTTSTSVWMRP